MNEEYRQNQALFSSVIVFDQNRNNVRVSSEPDGTLKREPYYAPLGAVTTKDGGMLFSFYAPDAKSVSVHGGGGTFRARRCMK